MKDIPAFTTENGVASLIMKQIPMQSIAYVKVLSSQCPELLLQECVEFCRACGAEKVYATGDCCLARFPPVSILVEMRCAEPEQTDASVFPVTEETVGRWRSIYNEKMANVPNAAAKTSADEKQILRDGDCYFVHADGQILGIGKASGDTIHVVASVKPGAGRDVVLAMASLLTEDCVRLIVARENVKAVNLYERLGFVVTGEVSRWYQIL